VACPPPKQDLSHGAPEDFQDFSTGVAAGTGDSVCELDDVFFGCDACLRQQLPRINDSVMHCVGERGPLSEQDIRCDAPEDVSTTESEDIGDLADERDYPVFGRDDQHEQLPPTSDSRVSTTAGPTSPPETKVGTTLVTVECGQLQLPSLGSALHHQGKCRPCMFALSDDGCLLGAKCRYCHICKGRSGRVKGRPCKGKRIHYNKMLDRIVAELEQSARTHPVQEHDAYRSGTTTHEGLGKVPSTADVCSLSIFGAGVGERPGPVPMHASSLKPKPPKNITAAPVPSPGARQLQDSMPISGDLMMVHALMSLQSRLWLRLGHLRGNYRVESF